MEISKDEICRRYPGIENEIVRVESWFAAPLTYRLLTEPISAHQPRIQAAYAAYEHHPDSGRRMLAICQTIRAGGQPWPIFRYGEDGFLLEGWHRIVAFHLLERPDLEVVEVGKIECPADGFDIAEVEFVQRGWTFSAEWRGRQIAHLRINADVKMPGPGRHVDNTFVLPAFRRRGLARRLYDAAEAVLNDHGLLLVPSPQPSLSDDALAFWRNRRPAAVKNDTRLRE